GAPRRGVSARVRADRRSPRDLRLHVRRLEPGADQRLDRGGVRPDPGADRRAPSVSGLSVPLESIMPCFQGVMPSWVTTCSADGGPNGSMGAIVHYGDSAP